MLKLCSALVSSIPKTIQVSHFVCSKMELNVSKKPSISAQLSSTPSVKVFSCAREIRLCGKQLSFSERLKTRTITLQIHIFPTANNFSAKNL